MEGSGLEMSPEVALACLTAAAPVRVSGRRVGGWSHSFPLRCDLQILGMLIRSEVVRQFECLPVFKQRKTNPTKRVNVTLLRMCHETERGVLKAVFISGLICLSACITCLMIPSCRLGWTQDTGARSDSKSSLAEMPLPSLVPSTVWGPNLGRTASQLCDPGQCA